MSYDITSYFVPEEHYEDCPISRPWMYDPDEFPLECICDEEDE